MAGVGGQGGLLSGSSLSPSLRALLNHEFKSVGDLDNASALLERLSAHLDTSQARLSHLHSSITASLAAWASHSRSTSSSLSLLTQKIQDFPPSASLSAAPFDSSAQQDFVGKLPLLAAEVARVERIRLYAETALRLEALVGDVEDAVASIVVTPRVPLPRKLAKSPASDILVDLSGKFSVATTALWKVEDVIVATAASWPQWKRLIMAVDLRVDSAFASLRPSAFADYRSKLEAIGWPPPLAAGAQGGEQRDTTLDNPLVRLQGEAKRKFQDSFVLLSTLQALQCQRKARQAREDSPKRFAVVGRVDEHELLWTIEELVAPIKSRAAYHFSKWSDKPELIFGLAYRVAQQNLQIVDIVLQPMLDRVKLPGYSVSEEWISALVAMVMHHLRSHTLAELAEKHILEDENTQEASSLWLHIVDLAISFDKKMQSLALKSVIPSMSKVELDTFDESGREGHSVVKCVSVFAERREWLELWADLELADAKEKLATELQKESAWLVSTQSGLVSSSSSAVHFEDVPESFRHPQSAEATMLKFWALINRCRCLPQRHWQLAFINHVQAPYMDAFLAKMLQKCQEAEALTALAEESAVLVVVSCINAACFAEHKLQEWSEDLFFLDLRRMQVQSDMTETENNPSPVEGCIFDPEISLLKQFQTEWLQKLVSATHRAFDASCQDYQRNKKRWQEEIRVTNGLPEDITISAGLVDSLAILQSRLRMFNDLLGEGVFVDLWRSLAASLDQFLMNTVVLSGARFSSFGSLQLAKDIEALFQIFKPFCVRPASFFPNLRDTALLLALPRDDVQQLQKTLTVSSAWRFRDQGEETRSASLKYYGVRSISSGTAGRILAQRFFAKA